MPRDDKAKTTVADAINEAKAANNNVYSLERIDDTHWRCFCGQTNHIMDSFCTVCSEPRPDEFVPKSSENEDTNHLDVKNIEKHVLPSNTTKNQHLTSQKQETNTNVDSEITNSTSNLLNRTESVVSAPTSKGQSSSLNLSFINKKILIGAIIFSLFSLGIYSFFVNKSERKNTVNNPTINQTKIEQDIKTKDIPPKLEQGAKTDLSLGGLDIGISIDDIHKFLGKENSSKTQGKYRFYYYNGLDVGCMGTIVHALVSDDSSMSTKRGVHVGSSLKEVTTAYGNDYSKFSYDGLDLYEYTYPSLNGEMGILRFAINDRAVVEYISVRIPDTPQIDVEEAKKAFREYHLAITNHNFKEAYNMLTSKEQNQIGVYDNYIKGYVDTLSSEVVQIDVKAVNDGNIVLGYRLKAHDRYKGKKIKEQIFSGTVNMVYQNGKWMIDGGEARKVNEKII